MNAREMHYDFKMKFNKLDSQRNRNLLVPEIDWLLNEAVDIFIKLVGAPHLANGLGLETSKITAEDIRTLIVPIAADAPNSDNVYSFPMDFRHFIRARAIISRGDCTNQLATVNIQQWDDTFEEDTFYKSSFEWREVNATYTTVGLQLHTDKSFEVNFVHLTYIKAPVYIHNAQDYYGGMYISPSGLTLSGHVSCDLPDHTHRTIVDIAVLLAAGTIQASDYQLRRDKFNFNQIV